MFSKPVSTLAVLAQMAWALSCGAFADEPTKKEEGKPNAKPVIAHIKISGSMDENPTDLGGLFASTPPETLKTLQERIEKAAKDPNVAGVLLEVGELSVGWGKLDEIEASIGKLRKAGKKIFAWTASEDTKEYLVAAMADEVAIPESVSLMIVGVRSSVTFYKELFDLIGVRADMLKVGDFKSAVEPYTRSNLSEPARKQLASMLDDFFDKAIVERIAKYRKAKGLTEEKVRTAIDEAPWVATRAKELGMVDTLAYFENFAASLPQQVGKPTATIARNYAKPKSKDEDLDLSNPFALLKALSPPKAKESKNPKVAVIHAVGEIVTGKGGIGLMGEEAVGSTTLIEAIQKAENDATVKAIVLRIDSPGGSALASDLIYAELLRCKKPVIASMSDVAASGGYYIAAGAKKILAAPSTITGSIGVFGGKLSIGGVYEKIGIRTDAVSRGANAGILAMERPFSPSERKAMTKLIETIYEQFLDRALQSRVKAGKKMSKEELMKLAGGRVWTGRQALENGLVDQLGTLEDAIALAAKEGGLPADKTPEILNLPKGKNFLDGLFDLSLEMKAERHLLDKLMLLGLDHDARALARILMLKKERAWLLPLQPIEVK